MDILFIGELIQFSRDDFLTRGGVGRKTVSEIEGILRKYGLRLGTKVEAWTRDRASVDESKLRHAIKALVVERTERNEGKPPSRLDEALIFAVRRVEKNARNIALTIRRLGWDGEKRQTLESIGRPLGLTRERVRQIEARTVRKLQRAGFVPDSVTQSIKIAERLTPAVDTEVTRALRDKGLTEKSFGAAGLVTAAEVFVGRARFRAMSWGKRVLLVRTQSTTAVNEIALAARRFVRSRGCANTFDLSDEFREAFSRNPSQAFIAAIVGKHKGFEWLNQDEGWFWYRPKEGRAHNRLINYLKRILAVSATVQLSEIRSALRRNYRTANFAPPVSVLASICDRVAFAQRNADQVMRIEDEIDWNSVLAATEAMFRDILRSHGPVLRREELFDHSLALGMNEHTFNVYSSYSPILSRPATGFYSLVGAQIPPGTIEDLRRLSGAPRAAATDHGWLVDGRVYAVWKVTKSMLYSGILPMPKSITSFVEGNFRLNAIGGESVGNIEVRQTTCWNLRRFFRHLGAEVDDHLGMIFDLKERQCLGLLGDAEAMSDLASGNLPPQGMAMVLEDEDHDDGEAKIR